MARERWVLAAEVALVAVIAVALLATLLPAIIGASPEVDPATTQSVRGEAVTQ